MNGQQGTQFDYKVDIVMCIDATGSMSPILNEVKANALTFHDRFVEAMEENNKDVSALRVKVIAFRDYGCDSEPMKESAFFELPTQNDAFHAFVNGIQAQGGGDGPENALEAIATALKSDWVAEEQGVKRRHVILLFTDAPALPLNARAGAPSYPQGMPADLAELGAWWEGTSQTFSNNYSINAGRLVVFAPNADPFTDMQAWNRVWPAFSQAGTGLSEIDIQAAIELLVGSI